MALWGLEDEGRCFYPGTKEESRETRGAASTIRRVSHSLPFPLPHGWEHEQHPNDQEVRGGAPAPLLSLRPLAPRPGSQCGASEEHRPRSPVLKQSGSVGGRGRGGR